MFCLCDDGVASADGPEEVRIRAQMEDEKKRYRDHFSALKALKGKHSFSLTPRAHITTACKISA